MNAKYLPNLDVVSAKAHDAWMAGKTAQGITSRKAEDGEELMVPYADLSEKAKELDRGMVRAVYAAIQATWAAEEEPIAPTPRRAKAVTT